MAETKTATSLAYLAVLALSGAVSCGATDNVIGKKPPAGGMTCSDASARDPYSPGYVVAAAPRVTELLGRMTLGQKIQQMQGAPLVGGVGNYDDLSASEDVVLDDGTSIRGYMYRDGPRGVNLVELQRERVSATSYSTSFPVTVARSASFDLELEFQVGKAVGDETAASRNTMLLAPCMNVLRHPLWGRTQETYGEDTFQTGRMASAFTVGVQQYVAACAKHFAANNIERGRRTADAVMDEQTLRETYGRHFRMVVQDGGVACVMASSNLINGTKATQNKHLLTDILRTDFGFKGFVISDWWAMPPPSEEVVTDPLTAQDNSAGAVDAGLDVEVPWINNFAELPALVPGRVSEATIESAARRILEQKFRFKSALGSLGDDAPLSLNPPTTSLLDGQISDNDAHLELAQRAAAEGMVLLKNDDATLPIKSDGSIKKVAVVGLEVDYELQNTIPLEGTFDFARDIGLGERGSSRVNADPAKTVGAEAGIQAAAASRDVTVTASNGIDDAVRDADFIVAMVGYTPADEGEEYAVPGGGDRTSFALPADQDELVAQLAALGKPLAVVIQAGSMVDMPWLDAVPAVVMAWYPGQSGGAALGQLLFGDRSFSGRLPFTWANDLQELPTFHARSGPQPMDYNLGYRYYDEQGIAPLRPFGFGLSYTSFAYSNLQLPCESVSKDGVFDVTVDIENTGPVAGDEVAMLFVSFPETVARRPAKELKAFARVTLAAGQTKSVTLRARMKDLDYFDMAADAWVTETGPVKVMVGPNAATLPLTGTLQVVD